MGEPVWSFQHTVDCHAPRQVAWNYWTNIQNWDDPPARFEMQGDFRDGARLRTILPDQTLESTIHEVQPGSIVMLDMKLPGADLLFHFTFEDADVAGSRITQRVSLSGANAEAFLTNAKLLEQTIPQGMAKLVAAIERSVAASAAAP